MYERQRQNHKGNGSSLEGLPISPKETWKVLLQESALSDTLKSSWRTSESEGSFRYLELGI